MTPEEHRELDKEVAEKVMGLPKCEEIPVAYGCCEEDASGVVWKNPDMNIDREIGVGYFVSENERAKFYEVVPRYSQSIYAAWQVVEKMQEQGWRCQVTWDKRDCYVTFAKEEKIGMSTKLTPEDGLLPPEAICRAALEATH